tara:strand:- start:89 stop:781 length:693 start_codon:yes stop_codon:yes gene_type:complete
MKYKQEAFEAKQVQLAEQAEKDRKAKEWQLFEQKRLEKIKQTKQVLEEESIRKHTEYLDWKAEQKILKEQAEQAPAEKVNTGIGIGHQDTWVLTWKSFSTHPDVVNLPLPEKVRLFKLAEQQQIDRLNYYANMHADLWSGKQIAGNADYIFEDGVIDESDNITVIDRDDTWLNSVDVNVPLTINAGVTLTVHGIFTTNALITNYGTIRVEGLVVENVSISNQGAGQVIVV